MEHRGYTGTVEYDAEEEFFYGRVLDIKDTITYEADCEERLEAAFRDSVDEYLDQCRACETEPEQPPVPAEC
jgi:predicted HicB family RNase H-like nuclease